MSDKLTITTRTGNLVVAVVLGVSVEQHCPVELFGFQHRINIFSLHVREPWLVDYKTGTRKIIVNK